MVLAVAEAEPQVVLAVPEREPQVVAALATLKSEAGTVRQF